MKLSPLLESVTVTPINDHVGFTINDDFNPDYYNKWIDIKFAINPDDFASSLIDRKSVSIQCIGVNINEIKNYIKSNNSFYNIQELIDILKGEYQVMLSGKSLLTVSKQKMSRRDAILHV